MIKRFTKVISIALSILMFISAVLPRIVLSAAGEWNGTEGTVSTILEKWISNAYANSSVTAADMPIEQDNDLIESIEGVVELSMDLIPKYIGPTGGKFITEIELIEDKTGWIEISNRASLEAMTNNLTLQQTQKQ